MEKFLKALLLSLFLFAGLGAGIQTGYGTAYAQQDQKEITLNLKKASMSKALKALERESGYKVVFVYEDVKQYVVTVNIKTRDINAALKAIIGNRPLNFKVDKKIVHVTAAQNSDSSESSLFRVTGKVYDETGNTIPGANIIIHGTRTGCSSDIDGEFTLRVHKGDMLVCTFIGYKPQEHIVKDPNDKIKIQLKPDNREINDVVVTAFGNQSVESVVGAITTVRPGDLKTTSSDLTTSFAGKIPGMIAWQTGGLPGALTENEMNTKFYIRGITSFQSNANTDPLIILDGVESSKLDLSRLAVEDIETFSVLKDASATALYGARGANGVILVTTKKGEEGQVYTTTQYQTVISMPTQEIETADPLTYMKAYNSAIIGRSNSGTPRYSVETINRTASGKYPDWVYPHNDWYDILFNNQAVNHRANVSIRGGSKVMQYYASVNYNHDEGMLKSDKLNDFDCNITNNQFNFRTNLNIQLAPKIQLIVNSATNIDRYHGPMADQQQAYAYAFNASPVDYAAVYPADEAHAWPHIRFGTTASKAINPYMLNQQGYKERTRYSSTNRAEYIQNLSSIVKGLELRLAASIVQTGYYDNNFTTRPYKYYLLSYDPQTGKHVLGDDWENGRADRTLSVGADTHTTDTRLTYEGRLYHSAAWGDHQTSLQGVFQAYERTFTPIESVLNGLPQRNLTYSMRGSYGYKNRYFAEGTFAYNGSERFAKGNRMGFFPSLGAAWVASSEKWMESVQNTLSYLKFRFSWGKVGNDGIITTPRYVYLQDLGEIGYGSLSPEANAQEQGSRYQVKFYGDPDIQWEIATQTNLGVEAKFFKGLLELQADFYQEIRRNILSTRYVIPSNMGIEIAPLDNIGSTRSRGIDLSAKVQHMFSNDLWFILNGTLTYNIVKYRQIEEATNKPEWQIKKGQQISQSMGYIAEGLFRDQAEIDASPRQDGDVMPGDIKYRDVNGDGVIDVSDAVFIGYPETPGLIYGFSGFFHYKNWELNVSFQGSGRRSFFINAQAISPFDGDRALLKAIWDDHWSEDNQNTHAFWPRLSNHNITHHNPQENWNSGAEVRKSTYFMRSCQFLRCTAIELSYSLPQSFLKKTGLKLARIKFTTNNPFCLTDFDLWDVELGNNGFNYPIQKTFAVGLNVNF